MKPIVVLLTLTATASVALADGDDQFNHFGELTDSIGVPNAYIAAGGVVGKDAVEFNGITGEGGMRLNQTPLFGRFLASAGNTSLDVGKGTFLELRVGIEGRRCTPSGMVCGSLGLDAGIHRGTFEYFVDEFGNKQKPAAGVVQEPRDIKGQTDTLIAVPRLTIDGGARVRARGVLELPQHLTANGPVRGVALSLALGVAF